MLAGFAGLVTRFTTFNGHGFTRHCDNVKYKDGEYYVFYRIISKYPNVLTGGNLADVLFAAEKKKSEQN